MIGLFYTILAVRRTVWVGFVSANKRSWVTQRPSVELRMEQVLCAAAKDGVCVASVNATPLQVDPFATVTTPAVNGTTGSCVQVKLDALQW